MGWTFRRSARLLPGVRLNFSKSGVGASFGVPGARISVSPNGRITRTVGIPGTGIYKRETLRPASRTRTTRSQGRSGHSAGGSRDPLQQALQLFQAGDLDAADTHAQKAMRASYVPRQAFVVPVTVFPGVTASLPAGRDAAALLLGEIRQAVGDRVGALDAVAQAAPTSHALLAACELLLADDRHQDVVDATDGVLPPDEAGTLVLVFRGVALRELGVLDGALDALDAAVRRAPTELVSGYARFERALTHQAAGRAGATLADLAAVPPGHPLASAARSLSAALAIPPPAPPRPCPPLPSPGVRPVVRMDPPSSP